MCHAILSPMSGKKKSEQISFTKKQLSPFVILYTSNIFLKEKSLNRKYVNKLYRAHDKLATFLLVNGNIRKTLRKDTADCSYQSNQFYKKIMNGFLAKLVHNQFKIEPIIRLIKFMHSKLLYSGLKTRPVKWCMSIFVGSTETSTRG